MDSDHQEGWCFRRLELRKSPLLALSDGAKRTCMGVWSKAEMVRASSR
jgi:hypothetical protein